MYNGYTVVQKIICKCQIEMILLKLFKYLPKSITIIYYYMYNK